MLGLHNHNSDGRSDTAIKPTVSRKLSRALSIFEKNIHSNQQHGFQGHDFLGTGTSKTVWKKPNIRRTKSSMSARNVEHEDHSETSWTEVTVSGESFTEVTVSEEEDVNYDSAPFLQLADSPVPLRSPTSVTVVFHTPTLTKSKSARILDGELSECKKVKKIRSKQKKTIRSSSTDATRSRSKSKSKKTQKMSISRTAAAIRIQALARSFLARRYVRRTRQMRQKIANACARLQLTQQQRQGDRTRLQKQHQRERYEAKCEHMGALHELRMSQRSTSQQDAVVESNQAEIQKLRSENITMRSKQKKLAAKIPKLEESNESLERSNHELQQNTDTLRSFLPKFEADRKKLIEKQDKIRNVALPAHRHELHSCSVHANAEQAAASLYGACLRKIVQRVAERDESLLQDLQRMLEDCKDEITSVE